MKFDPDIHRRRSTRLEGYDYSQAGAYFITICTQDRELLFGEVQEGDVELSDAGEMICRWWAKLDEKFSGVETDAFIVMPNHFHGIVFIDVGAAPCGRPESRTTRQGGRPHGVAPTLGGIVGWFKTMTTNEYIHGVKKLGWSPFAGRLWQRNYYDHVIRDEADLNAIRLYIMENPSKWAEDENNPERKQE